MKRTKVRAPDRPRNDPRSENVSDLFDFDDNGVACAPEGTLVRKPIQVNIPPSFGIEFVCSLTGLSATVMTELITRPKEKPMQTNFSFAPISNCQAKKGASSVAF